MQTNTTSALRLALAALVCTTLATTTLHAQAPANDDPGAIVQPKPSLRTGIWLTINGMAVRVNFEHEGRGAVHVCLYDSKGNALYDQREYARNYAGKFDVSELPAGVYTLDLRSADTHVIQAISIKAAQPESNRIALINLTDYFASSK